MKFGRDFEQELVPEWRIKYLNYKQAKKKLKSLKRALRNANRSPKPLTTPSSLLRPDVGRTTAFTQLEQNKNISSDSDDVAPDATSPISKKGDRQTATSPVKVPDRKSDEHSPLSSRRDVNGMTRYGSIIGSPPRNDSDRREGTSLSKTTSRNTAPSLHLPGPAVNSQEHLPVDMSPSSPVTPQRSKSFAIDSRSPALSDSKPQSHAARFASVFHPRRVNSMPGPPVDRQKRPLSSRVLSFKMGRTVQFSNDELPLEAYKDVHDRQNDFFDFLDTELDKIDTFFKQKETEATRRLQNLRDQLHILRELRIRDVKRLSAGGAVEAQAKPNGNGAAKASARSDSSSNPGPSFLSALNRQSDKVRLGHVGQTFQVMKDLGTPTGPSAIDMAKDFSRRHDGKPPSYKIAKHKLKVALAEYYRGLELLKSYALLNRTAFRKINKKFDKTVNARPPMRYMAEKVSNAYFVKSELIEEHIRVAEDLYARYFERGNHKVAVAKLRAKIAKAGEYSRPSFINGVLLALGAAFAIDGLVSAVQLLRSDSSRVSTTTTFLLQLYGGYFAIVCLALFFCLACRIWHRSKINYTFIFEFDTRRNVLDWRELSQIPSIFFAFLGLIMWLNFRRVGGDALFLLWPVVLVSVTGLVLFLPMPIFYPRSRQWFLTSLYRLVFAGLYPVEFRDFFIGDLFCSQTYALANFVIFSCLYTERPIWDKPNQCGASHLRSIGFITCLPGIWRALQCLRRYYDTRNIFPHMVNCGKYICTILQYLSLSLFRMNMESTGWKAFFIACAISNGLYTSVWDLAMDWSLLDPSAKYKFLRKTLAFKSTWPYYMAMIADPILRFNWIAYVIVSPTSPFVPLVGFLVAISEVCRRGMWVVFRVENEHCANVGRFRAYRDAPLPYDATQFGFKAQDDDRIDPRVEESVGQLEDGTQRPDAPFSGAGKQTSAADRLQQAAMAVHEPQSSGARQQKPMSDSPVVRALSRAGTLIHLAHTQDFERKRRPNMEDVTEDDDAHDADESDENTDEEIEDAELERERGLGRKRQGSG